MTEAVTSKFSKDPLNPGEQISERLPSFNGFKADVYTNIRNKPIVAIGGINKDNYKNLLLNKADFLAISSFIWKNKKLKPIQAIKLLK